VEHVVFFPAPDGTPAFRRLATVDDAARFVEHLRNVENVSEASVHTLTEVPLSFKTWYRVEIPNSEEGAENAHSDPAPTDAVALTTIAEVIESYGADDDSVRLDALEPVGVDGSSTGILVPEREFLPPVQIAFASPSQESAFYGQPVAEQDRPTAQVLEPAFGSRRERGTGYFVR
jgi:hypothetical protein